MSEKTNVCVCGNYTHCECYEKWDLKALGFWGFIKMLYAHHKPSGGALILRLALFMVFVTEGWAKVSNIPGTAHFLAMLGFVHPTAWTYLLAYVEFLGALCLLVGILTKPVCVALAVDMAVIIFGLHMGKSNGLFWGHTYEFFILLTLLSLYISGPGKYSLARLWVARKADSTA